MRPLQIMLGLVTSIAAETCPDWVAFERSLRLTNEFPFVVGYGYLTGESNLGMVPCCQSAVCGGLNFFPMFTNDILIQSISKFMSAYLYPIVDEAISELCDVDACQESCIVPPNIIVAEDWIMSLNELIQAFSARINVIDSEHCDMLGGAVDFGQYALGSVDFTYDNIDSGGFFRSLSDDEGVEQGDVFFFEYLAFKDPDNTITITRDGNPVTKGGDESANDLIFAEYTRWFAKWGGNDETLQPGDHINVKTGVDGLTIILGDIAQGNWTMVWENNGNPQYFEGTTIATLRRTHGEFTLPIEATVHINATIHTGDSACTEAVFDQIYGESSDDFTDNFESLFTAFADGMGMLVDFDVSAVDGTACCQHRKYRNQSHCLRRILPHGIPRIRLQILQR